MKKLNIKLLAAALFSFLVCSPFFGAEAKVTYTKGKVEVNRNGAWVTLKVGDAVKQSETINTGFQSEARLNLNGSVLAVPALTRVTLETLSTSDKKDKVSLYVDTGAVRSKVTHTANRKIDYTARTAVAVASVRGTDFTISAKGNVSCREGAVAVYSAKRYAQEMAEQEAAEEEQEEEGEGEEGSEDAAEEGSGNEEAPAEEGQSEDSQSEEGQGDSSAPEGSEAPEAPADNQTEAPAENASPAESSAPADNNTETSSNTNTNTQTPADSTTPATNISSNAPTGTVVVGAGQSTSFTTNGNPEKPKTDASQKSTKIQTQVSTMSEKTTETTESSPVTTPTTTNEPKKGTVVITISFEE